MALMRKAVSAIVASLWIGAALAQSVSVVPYGDELLKQENIYQRHGEERVKGYTVDRALSVYADGFSSEFERALAALGPADRWLDIGAGEGLAVLDYYAPSVKTQAEGREIRRRKARAVAMSIENRKSPRWEETEASLGDNYIQYLSGRRLGEYSSQEIGRFQVITDMMGGFSYTNDLTRFMETVLDLLEVNGTFFSVLQDIQREEGTSTPFYPGSRFLTEIADSDGSELKVCSWLKRIGCAEVKCEARTHWKPPVEAFRVRKVCEAVSVPPLSPVHFQAGTPPERRFQARR
jgi:hypothetical protein